LTGTPAFLTRSLPPGGYSEIGFASANRVALMVRDEVIRRALERTNWDLMACSMPSNVLLLTGYWPAAGYALASATREGQIFLVVPEDEDDIAEQSWADEVVPYCPAPLDRLTTAEDPVFEAFAALRSRLGLLADRIGFEQAEAFEPASYAPNLFRGSAVRLLRRAFPSATLAPADELLKELRAIKTPAEIEHICRACRIAAGAFVRGASMLRAGITEADAAAALRLGFTSCFGEHRGVLRCDGFTYCMSGPNSARAAGPYSRSGSRPIREGDLVVLRCHCYADGYWAEIARTYHLGGIDENQGRLIQAVFEARQAVLAALRPGERAADVDEAARAAIAGRGLERLIKHSTGHGAGFGAFDHTARPRLHPRSDDVIEAGMVIKLDVGVYSEEYGGVRNTDMVAVTGAGPRLLTDFPRDIRELAIQGTD
jgi:Xaa-Pro aminopeptidase